MARTIRLVMTFGVLSLQLVAFLNCSGGWQAMRSQENLSLSSITPPSVDNFKVVGDMLVHEDVYKRWEAGIPEDDEAVQSSHYLKGMEYWPDSIIPIRYDYNEAQFTATENQEFKNKMAKACAIWGQNSKIKCVDSNGAEKFYLAALLSTRDEIVTNCGGSYAGACATYPLGTQRRRMYVAANAEMPTVLHEFGHVLGFIHEHQRQDLQTYLTYPSPWPENVSGQARMAVMPMPVMVQNLGEYDPQSIMHYAFSNLSATGITMKPQYVYMQALMRTAKELAISPFDAEGVQRLYGAPAQAGRACETPSANKFIFPHGTLYQFFESSAPVNSSCVPVKRTCQNGSLSGSSTARFTSCVPVCQTRDGGQFSAVSGPQRLYVPVPNASTFYSIEVLCDATVVRPSSSTVQFCTAPGRCESVNYFDATSVVSFTNKATDYLFKAPVVVQDSKLSCTFQGQTVAHGGKVTAYRVATVPSGQSCSAESQSRSCSDGTLSGTYSYSSCVVEKAPTVMDYLTPIEQKRAVYVRQVYVKSLLREPDDRGLMFWSRSYEGFNGCRNITRNFVASDEAAVIQNKLNNADFINYAYDVVLGRSTKNDAAGAAFWLGHLDRGDLDRKGVLNAFFDSDELKVICERDYGIEP